jgi:transposase
MASLLNARFSCQWNLCSIIAVYNQDFKHAVDRNQSRKQSTKRLRRSVNDKLAILKEAEVPGSNVSAVARKHGVTPQQLFNWRRQFQAEGKFEPGEVDLPTEYQNMLSTIRQREELLEQAASKIADEAASDKIGAYNLSCSVSNLVTATGKLHQTKLELLEKLALAQEAESSKRADGRDPDDVVDFEIERESERVCYELVKGEVMRKRAEAAAVANMVGAQSS